MTLALVWVGTAAIAAVLCYRRRDSAVFICGVIASTPVLWAIAFLCTGPSSTYFFENAAGRFIGTVIVTVVSVLGAVYLLPKVRGAHAGRSCLVLCLIVAAMYAALGLSLWRAADDGLHLATLPEIDSREKILALHSGPASDYLYGILVPARLGAIPVGSKPQEGTSLTMFMGCRDRLGIGTSGDAFFPSVFTATLPDGSIATVQGITSVKQADGWPPTGRRMDECGLRDGDAVVIWADPGATREFGNDVANPALNAVRIVAYGDLDSFRRELGHTAQRVGRATLALAGINGGLSAVAVLFGFVICRQRQREKNRKAEKSTGTHK